MIQHSLSWVYYQKKMKTLNSKRYACPVSCSSIYCSQEMEAAQVSLHRWMGTEDGGCDCVYVCVCICIFSSVCAHMGTHTHWNIQFSRSVVSDSLSPHESQHARPACPSPTPGVHSDSGPSSQWCHPAISSSVVPFSSCPQSLPASESFPMSQFFTWDGQSTGVSALASFLPKKSQGWSPSEWTGWIPLQSKGLSRVFSNTTV